MNVIRVIVTVVYSTVQYSIAMVLCYAGNVINGIIKVTIWYGNGEVMATRAMYSWSHGLSGILRLT